MTDDTTKKETLKIGSPAKLTLTKTVDAGKVKQKFTHGREKAVTVEVRKQRVFTGAAGGGMVEVKQAGGGMRPSAGDLGLTEGERAARIKALKLAEEVTRNAPARPEPVREEEVASAPTAPKRENGRDGIVVAPQPPVRKTGEVRATQPTETDDARERAKEKESARDTKGKLKLTRGDGEQRRNSSKITVTQALTQAEDQRVRSLASIRRQREKALKKAQGGAAGAQEKVLREVIIPEAITVQELASRMAVRAVDVIKTLMKLGMMVTVTQTIDADTAELVVGEFGHKFKRVAESDVESALDDVTDAPEDLQSRPPVVTIMGHVDHGKTSLLDALRGADVAAGEAGGITQHIGAYQVDLGDGKVTFLDTPGHEAFTAMRARGAKVTDIVVLVVAADDGIMAQTKEAIAHAKAAGVPIIVAVNKIDKPDADPSRVKTELMSYELVPEEFGGDTIVVEVSAKQKLNLDKLVETILLQAEVLELKANPNRPGRGAVIESRLDQGRGVVATLLVQKGTLKVGDLVVAGAAYGRVRSLTNDKGVSIKEAGPGMPVEIQGLSQPPEAGDMFDVAENEKVARDIAEYRARSTRAAAQAIAPRTMEQMFGAVAAGTKELPVIVRGDVQGSVEAIAASLTKIGGEEVRVKLLHTAVGAVSESDVTLAKATNALIIGFNVRASAKAKELAAREKVNIRYYSVIYDVVDDVKAAASGLLSPTLKENFIGYAEIRQIFNISKAGKVGGCYVTEGVVRRGAGVRLLRDGVVIHQGTLKTLKRFKDEVKEVKSGFECGMAFENYEDIREGDVIEAFETVEEARTV